MDVQEVRKLDAYLKRLFGNQKIRVVPRPKKDDSAEVYIGEEFIGVLFVDVLNTMLDDTLPLTPPEWPEWGNPIESEKDLRTILSYSPYDNIAAKDYPAILAMGGLTDPRVTYWEPAKWIARLRATMSGGGPVLLRTNMGAGHGGASGRFNRLDEIAIVYAFALWAVGMAEGEA